MIVEMPRPSVPSRQATVLSSSISAEALARLPSLSLSHMRRNTLRLPSGSTRGTTKQVSPPGATADMRKTSLIGAEQNHLCPVRAYVPASSGAATVVLARTSEPPCFSVIAMPARQPAFSAGDRKPKSYDRAVSRGVHCAASSSSAASAGTAAWVMDNGHPLPGSAWFHR